MPYRKLFLSRWSALFWAGGILWTAYDVASDAPDEAPATNATAAATPPPSTGDPATDRNLVTLARVMNGN